MSVAAFPSQPPKKEDDTYQELPACITSEQAVLGAILLNNNAMAKCDGIIVAGDFFDPVHKRIFEVASDLISAGKVASPTTLRTWLGDGDIGGLTMPEYLARLAAEGIRLSEVAGEAETVRDFSLCREGIARAQEQIKLFMNIKPSDRIDDMINKFEDGMADLRPRLPDNGEFETFDVVSQRALKKASDSHQSDGVMTGIMSGLSPLDKIMGGFQPGDFVVIAARPGMGKTAMSAGMATNAAIALAQAQIQEGEERGVIAFLSLEMKSDQIAVRQLCEQASVVASKVRRNTITADDYTAMDEKARALQGLPLVYDESTGLTINQVTKKCRALHRKKPLRLVIVDYLQLMQGSGKTRSGKDTNRVQDVTEITTGLKSLAKELNCPVVGLSQLSRAVENRDDKRPQLSDLRESGSIEQDADSVIFIYREEYYVNNKKPGKSATAQAWTEWELAMESIKGRAELIIAKNRHGQATNVDVGFDAEMMRFESEPPPSVAPGDDDAATQYANVTKAEKQFLLALFDTLASRGLPPPSDLPCSSSVGLVADYGDFKRAFRDRQAPEGLPKLDGLEGDDLAAAEKEHSRELERIKKALQRARDGLDGSGVIKTARAGSADNGRPYIWHTGKAVRGVPQTWPDRKPRRTASQPAATPADPAADQIAREADGMI